MREWLIMLLATLAATAVTMLIYRLVTPAGWSRRTAFSNRAKMLDAALIFGLCAVWGVLLYRFLSPWLDY